MSYLDHALVFTARWYAERSIANAIVCPCPSVCLSVCLSVSNVDVSWSYRLEFLENNFTAD